jgi:hypothetical protein
MPVITFPKGPDTAPKEDQPELQEGDVESSFWECGCGCTTFYLWADGEAVCSQCEQVLPFVFVTDISSRVVEDFDVCA